MRQIGTVQILWARAYPLDSQASNPAMSALVEPGVYPVYEFKGSYFWLLEGKLNEGQVFSRGAGMFTLMGGDVFTEIPVKFPSRFFGEEDFKALMTHDPIAQEGHPSQRLRFNLTEEIG